MMCSIMMTLEVCNIFPYYITNSDNHQNFSVKKKKTKKRKKRKKKKKKQGKNDPLNYTSGFSCWKCNSADSYADCMTHGEYETCDGGSIGCFIEVRSRRDNKLDPREIGKIEMGCKQLQACISQHRVSTEVWTSVFVNINFSITALTRATPNHSALPRIPRGIRDFK